MTRDAGGATGQGVSGNGVYKASDARCRALLANVADMVTISDRDGRIIYASPATQNVSGYTPEEFMARNPFDSIHPEDRPRCEEALARLANSPGLSLELEDRVRRKDGSWRWVEGTFASLFDDPDVGGLLATVRDITEHKRTAEALRRASELDAYRVALVDALSPLLDPVEIQARAARVLGEHLGANRVVYGEIEDDGDSAVAVIAQGYASGVPPLTGRFGMADFGLARTTALPNDPVVVHDVMADPTLTDDEKARYAGVGIGAWIGVPLTKGGRFVAVLGVHQRAPRDWTAHEVALVEETAERTWAAVERARAEEALRESEEKYRTLFTAMDQGFCIVEKIETAAGEPSDFRYLTANPAFGRHTGMRNVVGKTIREMVPNAEQEIMNIYDEVARTGRHRHFEGYVSALDLWMEAEVFPARVPTQIAVLFNNVSERKRAELALRQSEERLQEAISIDTVGVLFFNLDGRMTDANEAFARMAGYSRNELLDTVS